MRIEPSLSPTGSSLAAYSYGVLEGSVTFDRVTMGARVTNLCNDRSVIAQSGAITDPTTSYIFQPPRAILGQLKVRL